MLTADRDPSKRQHTSVHTGPSWQLRRPLQVAGGAVWARVSPKQYLRHPFVGALTWLRSHPELKPYAVSILHLIPPLERRLSRFANANDQATLKRPPSSIWAIDADPEALSEWRKITDEARRMSGIRQR